MKRVRPIVRRLSSGFSQVRRHDRLGFRRQRVVIRLSLVGTLRKVIGSCEIWTIDNFLVPVVGHAALRRISTVGFVTFVSPVTIQASFAVGTPLAQFLIIQHVFCAHGLAVPRA